jgi:hypothetical protein
VDSIFDSFELAAQVVQSGNQLELLALELSHGLTYAFAVN